MHHTRLFSVSIGLPLLNTAVASASVTLSPSLSGTATLDPRGGGLSEPGNVSIGISSRITFTGYPEQLTRGFLYFDLTAIAAPVNAATLQFRVDILESGPPGPAFGGVGFYDVTTTPDSSRADRWIDYGSGEQYGGRGLREDVDVGSMLQVPLSSTAVANINATGGPFGIGVTGNVDHESGYLETSAYELVLETVPAAIPEPKSLVIFAAYSLLGLLLVIPRSLRRRRLPQ